MKKPDIKTVVITHIKQERLEKEVTYYYEHHKVLSTSFAVSGSLFYAMLVYEDSGFIDEFLGWRRFYDDES